MAMVFKIVHPNGCPAHIRAPREWDAVEALIKQFNDQDWKFGQSRVLREETGPIEIVMVGEPAIPTRVAETRT
jgi:hypothetical protein